MAAQLQDTDSDTRPVDYSWHRPGYDPGFWATVNRFCGDCIEYDCPVLRAVLSASANRGHLHLPVATTAVQDACPYVAEYHEAADAGCAIRRSA